MARVGLQDSVGSGGGVEVERSGGASISAVCGSLGASRIGMSEASYDAVRSLVTAIIHAGARVSLTASYDELRAANVKGTSDILALAFACDSSTASMRHPLQRGATVTFISSFDVFGAISGGAPHTYLSRFVVPFDEIERKPRGYAHSKWVGERLCCAAAERGLSVTIVRLDLVTAMMLPVTTRSSRSDAERGVCSARSWTERVLRGLLHHRAIPSPSFSFSNAVGVDVASKAIVAIASGDATPRAPPFGRAFHIANPNPQPSFEMLAAAVEAFSVPRPAGPGAGAGSTLSPLRRVPYQTWRAEIEADESSPLFTLWSGFAETEEVPAFGTKRCEVSRMLVPPFADEGDRAAGVIECAKFDESVAVAMLLYMQKRGEL
jgi:nucleoside-diphosphate-sugar epimerase